MAVGLFLDRDGTIIKERGHLGKIDRVSLVQNAKKGLIKFSKLDLKIIIVSNQSGIARGLFTIKDCRAVNQECVKKLGKNVRIDKIYFCPHFVQGNIKKYAIECECRKPKIGMLLRAARRFDLDLKRAFIVGDSMRDIAAGWQVKAKTILVLTGITKKREISNGHKFSKKDIEMSYRGKLKGIKLRGPVDYIANDLLDAYRYVRNNL